jgi:hypothetical protein
MFVAKLNYDSLNVHKMVAFIRGKVKIREKTVVLSSNSSNQNE